MSKIIDLTGQRFGQLVVIGRAPSTRVNGFACWACRCDCGLFATAVGVDLRAGHKKSCGHLQKEMLKDGLHVSHGNRRGRRSTPEYQAWLDMRKRCGASWWKDVKVCRKWRRSFEDFLADVG